MINFSIHCCLCDYWSWFMKINSGCHQFSSRVPLQEMTVQQDDVIKERRSAVIRKTKQKGKIKLENFMESGELTMNSYSLCMCSWKSSACSHHMIPDLHLPFIDPPTCPPPSNFFFYFLFFIYHSFLCANWKQVDGNQTIDDMQIITSVLQILQQKKWS